MASAYLDRCDRHWLGRGFPLSYESAHALAKPRTSPPTFGASGLTGAYLRERSRSS